MQCGIPKQRTNRRRVKMVMLVAELAIHINVAILYQ
jgi:hypothetical protein